MIEVSPLTLPQRDLIGDEIRRRTLAQQSAEALREPGAFHRYFPAEGPYRRELYPRSMLFFAAGRWHRERLFMAANRCSKTVTCAYEVTAHLTGLYPDWWPGRRFDCVTEWWAAGDTREMTRDIVQFELCGGRGDIRRGTYSGMIPGYLIIDRSMQSGIADAIDTIWIEHKTKDMVHGARQTSTLQFKAYNQGRLAFQGTSKHGIWIDEEPPDASEAPTGGGTPSGAGDVYTECLLRTATTEGITMASLTPLRGLTPFIDHYLETATMCDASTGLIVNAKQGIFGDQHA